MLGPLKFFVLSPMATIRLGVVRSAVLSRHPLHMTGHNQVQV
jgi:hypothetical protein